MAVVGAIVALKIFIISSANLPYKVP
eukprot:jgi/Chlat1/7583/Chrsp63S07070